MNNFHTKSGVLADPKSCVSPDLKLCVSPDLKSCVSHDLKSCVSPDLNSCFSPDLKSCDSCLNFELSTFHLKNTPGVGGCTFLSRPMARSFATK